MNENTTAIIIKLAEGSTYYGTVVLEVLDLLVDGDEVAVWAVNGKGFRGVWSCAGESRNIGGWYIDDYNLVEITVTSLVPRRPEWADALVVRDRDGDHYLRHPEWDDDWTDASGAHLVAEHIAQYAPITVVVDADGLVRP